MSIDEEGEEFWAVLEAAQNNLHPDASDAWAHADAEINDESSFGPTSGDENDEIEGVFDLFSSSRTTEDSDAESTEGGAFSPFGGRPAANLASNTPSTEPSQTSQPGASKPSQPDGPPIPRLRSIAHHAIVEEKAWFLSLDVETGGDRAGIIQLSGELGRFYLESKGKSATMDCLRNVYREPETFNRYVNPGEGVWFEEATVAVHGIHPSDSRITGADKIGVVWREFCAWIDRHVSADEKIVLIAYNGENCEAKWLWKLTQTPYSPFHMPPQCEFFMDPYNVVKHFKGCPLNHSKSKLDSYELGMLWSL